MKYLEELDLTKRFLLKSKYLLFLWIVFSFLGCEDHTKTGINHFDKRHFSSAMISLQKAIEIDNSNLVAHHYIGKVYYNLGNIEKAIEKFDYVLKLDTANANAFFDRAMAYRRQENFEKGNNDFLQAYMIDKEYIRFSSFFPEAEIKIEHEDSLSKINSKTHKSDDIIGFDQEEKEQKAKTQDNSYSNESKFSKPTDDHSRKLKVYAEAYLDGIVSINVIVLNSNGEKIKVPHLKNWDFKLYDSRGRQIIELGSEMQSTNNEVYIDVNLGNKISMVKSVEVFLVTQKNEIIRSPKTKLLNDY